MTNRDPAIVKAGNDVIARLEELGESPLFLDGQSPFAISVHQKNGKIYCKAILVLKDGVNNRGNPVWRADKKIHELLDLGFNQVLLVSIDGKTRRQSIINYNSKGIMFGTIT